MAKYDFKRLAARFAGKVAVPEVTVVSGAAINTNIAVAGINKEDALLAVIRFTTGTTLASDLVGETKCTSAGNIQLTTTNTTGDKLLVLWYKVRP